jgi:peptidoglycan/xylan/chitin deacetylase (PgdA/CDA1 family)
MCKRIFIFIFITILLPFACHALESPGSLVRIFNSEKEFVREFYIYDQNLKFGVNALAEDFNGDKKVELITVPQQGGGPQIMVQNLRGKLLLPGFFVFSEDYRGGVNIASGDVNGDGVKDLIVMPATEASTWVKVYSLKKNKIKIILEFEAYSGFTGGAYIASGDVNGDGKDEIITGAGKGGGPQVIVFNNQGEAIKNFFAYPDDFKGGVAVAAGDIDKDDKDEIIVGQASDAPAWVKVYECDVSSVISEFQAYPGEVNYGVTLQTGDFNSDGKDEIITGTANMGGPQVRIFNKKGKNLDNFFAYNENFRGNTKTIFNEQKKIFVSTFSLGNNRRIITGPKVALTFDDGYSSPNGSFNKILDVLKAHDLQVTFFLLGDWIEDHPSEMQRIINDGHEIGNHSYNHPLFTILSEAQIRNEVISNENLIKQFGVDPKPVFRYPYGGHNAYTDAVLASLGYKYWQWTASTGDTGPNKNDYNAVLWGALAGLHDGSIILAHCANDTTASALDQIINTIQNAGYNIVKISELDN